jgi:hypothetical protein
LHYKVAPRVTRLTTICGICIITDNMVDPSGLGIRMKVKCIVCGFEKQVDNGVYQKDTEAFHLSETGHQGWTTEFLEDENS